MAQNVLSVTQINEYIRAQMDNDPLLCEVAVRGEISNYKLYPSGHHYFTIKDEGGALKCVMFKGNAFRLRFRPENGMKIIAMGKISVYPRDGAYQLYCSTLVLDGVGDLHAAFEQLKERLAAKGLFDPIHKKPIPKYPAVIGVVTSSAGAALHDMLRILRKRYPLTEVRLFPVRVQGVEAPAEIAAAIRYANQHRLADLLIVGRGGGSIEDLWAFNDELVAYAIYDSEIPIISAVGHEPDVTISDYVADLRAATPSNGAELAVPDKQALMQNMDGICGNLAALLSRQLSNAKSRLDLLSKSPVLTSPQAYFDKKSKDVAFLAEKLTASYTQALENKKHNYASMTAKLDAMSPLKVLSRGYSMAQTESGQVMKSVYQVECGDTFTLTLSDGSVRAIVDEKENMDG